MKTEVSLKKRVLVLIIGIMIWQTPELARIFVISGYVKLGEW